MKAAVDAGVLSDHGKKKASEFMKVYGALGRECKSSLYKHAALYSLANVTNNVPLNRVLCGDDLQAAEDLALMRGIGSLDDSSLGNYTFLIAAPALRDDDEVQREIATQTLTTALVSLLDRRYDDIWKIHGDQIALPDSNGVVKTLATSVCFFSDETKGRTRKETIVLSLLAVYHCPIIAARHSDELGNINYGELSLAFLRCPATYFIKTCRPLKKGDLFVNTGNRENDRAFVDAHVKGLLQMNAWGLFPNTALSLICGEISGSRSSSSSEFLSSLT